MSGRAQHAPGASVAKVTAIRVNYDGSSGTRPDCIGLPANRARAHRGKVRNRNTVAADVRQHAAGWLPDWLPGRSPNIVPEGFGGNTCCFFLIQWSEINPQSESGARGAWVTLLSLPTRGRRKDSEIC